MTVQRLVPVPLRSPTVGIHSPCSNKLFIDFQLSVNVDCRVPRVTIAVKELGAEGGTRTPTSCLTRPSNVRVCQFRHFGMK